MTTKKITKIISTENGDNYVADIEGIENRITQNSSNLETAKQELTNKCNEALNEAKAYTDNNNFFKSDGSSPLTPTPNRGNASLICLNRDDSCIRIFGGTPSGGSQYEVGGQLILNGKDRSEQITGGSMVALRANVIKDDKHTNYDLRISKDGRLTFNEHNVVRFVNGVNADNNGNVQLGNCGAITGEIKWFAFNTVPDGYIICNGAKVSRTTYADLFAAIGTSFGNGDGSTTFTLPNLIDRFAQGSRTVGTYKGPGLPNITGGFWDLTSTVDSSTMGNADGVFFTKYTSEGNRVYSIYNTDIAQSPYGNKDGIGFNASRSNSIYGNSTTVQPPTLTLLPCIKY